MPQQIIVENGKTYILTNIADEMKKRQIFNSCLLCDISSKPSNCSIYYKNGCQSKHCYKLVEKQEKSKMKFSEIKFKVVTDSPKRNQLIVDMVNKFLTGRVCDDRAKVVKITNASLFYYLTQHIDEVEGDAKEVTFEEAIKILESCEPVVKKPSGKFVEYDIDKNGAIQFRRDIDDLYYPWQAPDRIENSDHIFAGWFWEHPEDSIDNGWSLNRKGINRTSRSMTSICEDWEYPLIPTKIRFWVKD